MKILKRSRLGTSVTTAVLFMLILLLPVWQQQLFGQSDKTPLSSEERIRLGERMYREGVLPSGNPMRTSVKGNTSLPGTIFSCESCHLRSGLGSFQDNVLTPPTNGVKLFKPQQAPPTTHPIEAGPFRQIQYGQSSQRYPVPRGRPEYTDESLANALRSGIDSAGRTMNDIMPRYSLEDEDMKLLISYLKSLSSEYSPGASDTTLHFATIVTDDVSPEDRHAMLVPLENFIKNTNELNFFDGREALTSRSTRISPMAVVERMVRPLPKESIRRLSLSRWVLKGPPETWRHQLEEYNRKAPAFAILGGITSGEWQPIHQFCEENHIPNLFPMTNFPVISQTDWYTLYLSKGYYQEGEGAARFINENDQLKDKPILQIVRDTNEGRSLSRGFQETWRDFGQKPVEIVILKEGEVVTAELVQQKLDQEKPGVIILWDGPESIKMLEMLADGKNRPAMVLVSSTYLGKSMFSLNEQVRDFTYLTYPYGITPGPGEKSLSTMVKQLKFDPEVNAVPTNRISQKSYGLTLILGMALTEMRGNCYRDNLLDVIGAIMDQDVPLYGRISFGQGQRYASRGCYIVQLAKSKLVKKSGWLID